MKNTNNFKLPDRVIRVIKGNYKQKPPNLRRLSVIDCIDDPLMRILYLQHYDLIVRDYSDMLTMTQGTALHDRYEMVATDDEDVEHKFEDEIDGITVVGKADSYFDKTILDVKQTGVYGPKYRIDKWTKQLNIYAWQRRKRDDSVIKLFIDVWYRDWKQNKAYYKDYPPIPFEVIELDLWSFEKQDEYIKSQVHKHLQHPVFDSPDEYTKPCSDKQRGIRWEAYKGKNKTPSKVGDTKQEVEDYTAIQDYKWTIKQSQPVFCENYCKSRSICPFNRKEVK